MHVFLETDRLVLRRLTEADVDNLVELDSDPQVMRYLSGGDPTPRDVMEREILPRFLSYYERYPAFGYWAAIDKSSGEFLGWFSFKPNDPANPAEVELGYRLRRAAWGRGHATEGARALIDLGFSTLGVARVTANTYQDNLGSRRVMEKAGMTHTRSYRLEPEDIGASGSFHATSQEVWDGDDVEYAIERAEWERQRGA
jgi:RimJ/RimL family protein N-acetyltransferase